MNFSNSKNRTFFCKYLNMIKENIYGNLIFQYNTNEFLNYL